MQCSCGGKVSCTGLPQQLQQILLSPPSCCMLRAACCLVVPAHPLHVEVADCQLLRLRAAAAAAVATSFSAFGIFDGHGGKPAATFASKELLPMVMRLADRCVDGSSSSSGPSRQASAAAAAAADGVDDEACSEAWGVEVTEEDRAVWAAQEALVERLPKVRRMMP